MSKVSGCHERESALGFCSPLGDAVEQGAGAMHFLRRMQFLRLDEFMHLHRQLAMPTMFVWGSDDPTFPIPIAPQMLSQFPNVAGFHAVANAKLLVHAEQPHEVAQRIEGFLA